LAYEIDKEHWFSSQPYVYIKGLGGEQNLQFSLAGEKAGQGCFNAMKIPIKVQIKCTVQ
jgi:hypothetical protein